MSRVDNDSESLRPQLAVTIFASPDVAQTFPSPNQQTTRDTPGLLPIPTQVIQDRDAEQNRYLLRVALLLDRYQRVFKRLQELATQASTSSMLLFDPSWKKQMKDVGEEIQQIGREIRALTPPKHLESLHLDLISASRHFDFAMERMLYGIENFNVDAIQEGITSMYTGIEHIDRANRKIEALKQ